MNYQIHYDRLIERAKNRVLSGYVEVHHIVPKCMGGNNDKSNLVALTAEEHFVAHQLLHKIYPNVRGLKFALVNMTGNPHGKRSNKLYAWIRRAISLESSKLMKEKFSDIEFLEKWNAGMKKMRANPEIMKKISDAISKANKGRVKSEKERANIAEAGRNRKPRVFSEQARANMAVARLKTWEERRLKGEHLLIGAKVKAKRIENGTYDFTEEHKKNIGLSGKGRTPWNKGKSSKKEY